jgi:hypothetical protein
MSVIARQLSTVVRSPAILCHDRWWASLCQTLGADEETPMKTRALIRAVAVLSLLLGLATYAQAQTAFNGVYVTDTDPQLIFVAVQSDVTVAVAILTVGGEWRASVVTNFNPESGVATGSLLNADLTASGTIQFRIAEGRGIFLTSGGEFGAFTQTFP